MFIESSTGLHGKTKVTHDENLQAKAPVRLSSDEIILV